MATKLKFKDTTPIMGPSRPTPFSPEQAEAAMLAAQSNPAQPEVSAAVLSQPTPQGFRSNKSLEAQLREAIEQDFITRQEQQAQEREMIKAKLSQPTQADLTPLMGLAAQISGSNAPIQGYRAPADQGDEVAKQLQQLAGNQRGLTQDRISNLKTMLEQRNSANSEKNARQLTNIENSAFDKSQKQFGKLTNDASTYREDSANVIDAITPRNGMVTAGRVSQALAKFSRLMGEKGVLTDQDLGRTLERTIGRDIERFRTYLSGQPEGALVDAATVANMQQAMKVATKAFEDSFKKKAAFYKNTWDKHPVVGAKFRDQQGWGYDMYNQTLVNTPSEPSFADLGSAPSANYVKAGVSQEQSVAAPVNHQSGAAAELARRAAMKAGK
jgi:hypothetical protein